MILRAECKLSNKGNIMAVNRVEDLIPQSPFLDGLRMLAARDKVSGGTWMQMVPEPGTERFNCVLNRDTLPAAIRPLLMTMETDRIRWTEACGMLAFTEWLKDQPRVVRPTAEQLEAFQHVEMNLPLGETTQPFPAVFVETPIDPFIGVLVYRHCKDVLVMSLFSKENLNDIVCAVRDAGDGTPVETYLQKLDEDLMPLQATTMACQRVAMNVLLALSNYGVLEGPLQPKQHAENLSWAKEQTPRGERASFRVREALYRLDFARPLVVRRAAPKAEGGEDTGRVVRRHWVRGHWKNQAYGEKGLLRKRILIGPYLAGSGEVIEQVVAYTDKR